MTSVPPYRVRVPLLLGGAGARRLAPLLIAPGFHPKSAARQPGAT